MSEPTAAERAIQYVAEASWRGDGWVADDFEAKGSTYVWGAKQMITALLAHPDLLVDLAIEAGGLEQVTGSVQTWRPVYRRTRHEVDDRG